MGKSTRKYSWAIGPAALALLTGVGASVAIAGLCGPPEQGDLCPAGTGPDVIVGDMTEIMRFGTVGTRTSYAVSTMACNYGDQFIPWEALTANHPIISQNIFRLKDNRLEHIGMSWVKHGFTAFQDPCCCVTCVDTGDFDRLNVGCSDIYNPALNANQAGFSNMAGLGPRSDINPVTGAFPFPYTTQGLAGDDIYKRLQVEHVDLDPLQNPGARYFVEAQYITPQDAAAGNGNNNASNREFTIGVPHQQGGWELNLVSSVNAMQPAIEVWDDIVPGVQIQNVDIPNDGRLIVAYHVTDNGDGTWHYEYAVHNLNSNRGVQQLSVPSSAALNVTSPGFHDIDHHSGEAYDPTDWTFVNGELSLNWFGATFASNPNANALRWATMYNFWFDADAPPVLDAIELTLFLPGSPSTVSVAAMVPDAPIPPDCPADIVNNDNTIDTFDLLELLMNWGTSGVGADIAPPTNVVDVFDLLELLNSWGPCA